MASLLRRRKRRRRLPRFLLLVSGGVLLLPLIGWHWASKGWIDHHINYPAVPNGYNEIVNTFGLPCNDNAHAVWTTVREADTGNEKTVWFHRKLGGLGTEVISNKGGKSTNFDNDVFGHIKNKHLMEYVKSGVGGYNCRYIAGTTKYSTHAWGIAIDVSWNYEPNGDCSSNVNYHHSAIWKSHNWTWGAGWCDPMHFQYATGY
jgi:hypothetical protein